MPALESLADDSIRLGRDDRDVGIPVVRRADVDCDRNGLACAVYLGFWRVRVLHALAEEQIAVCARLALLPELGRAIHVTAGNTLQLRSAFAAKGGSDTTGSRRRYHTVTEGGDC